MKPESKIAPFRDYGRRVKAQFWLKTIGVPTFMVLFFWGYIQILNHAFFPVTVMPLTAIDRWIPYQNSAWLLYVSLWVYVQWPLSLIDNRYELVLYGWVATVVSLIGFAIFILWPTAVPPVDGDVTGVLLKSIRRIDTTGNSCPSLHVAFAVFTAAWIERFIDRARSAGAIRLLNVAWCLGIVYSTLATKQHVLLDVIPGALLGYFGAVTLARLENRRREREVPAVPAQISPAARKL